MITYGIIEEYRQNRARRLAEMTIPMVNAKGIGRWNDPEHLAVRAFMRKQGADLPGDFWFGAWDSHELIGMIHSGPPVGNGTWLIPRASPDARLPQAFTPEGLVNYFTGNTLLEEIAVVPGYQRQGIGRRLLYKTLKEARSRFVRNFCAAATSDGSADFFRSAGMDIQPVGKTLHPSRADGLRTGTISAWSHIRWATTTP